MLFCKEFKSAQMTMSSFMMDFNEEMLILECLKQVGFEIFRQGCLIIIHFLF